jgi:predicted ATPase/class 3 adenylate cyclase/Flp pilus assembly protein TadD
MATLHALLLTDVVGSTRLTEQIGDAAMADVWAAHNRVARDLLSLWRGREIDKSDGMLSLFDSVEDAAGYALAYHRAVSDHGLPLQARAGIHVGPVILRPNPAGDVARGAKPLEVDGIALPIVGRVMSVALGGQTLISADAQIALGESPHSMRSHGHWRLQGIADPIELFELTAPGAPFRVPADSAKAYRVWRDGDLWRPAREIRHSVPAERDRFVGRQQDLQRLANKLDAGTRLVSVLGIGGTGKTRLVTRFAWAWLGEYPGGAWFCDLSQARSMDGIVLAVAQGLEMQLGKADPVEHLASAISGRGKCLIVLDNFEQVARHGEETLGVWLERAPLAQFLVTTREVLGIVGEETMALAPLTREDAAELFLRRAEAAKQGFAPGADGLAAIDELVKVLDGLPLAIELAAARVRVMSPRSLLARMNNLFDVLYSRAGRRDRQATLRAAFDWSWELLSEPEKAALARLSVFEGGFTLDSAAAVIQGAGATSSLPAADLVHWLVDKSLVRQTGDDRFDLLETVREYAAQHLRTAGRFEGSGPGSEATARANHWQHFAGLDLRAVTAHRCVEVNNLVAACRAAAAAGHGVAATDCLARAWAALELTGPYRAGLELAQRVEALDALGERERGLVHWVVGSALDLLGEAESARVRFEQGLSCAVRADAPECEARLLLALGTRQTRGGDIDAAFTHLTEANRLATRLADLSLQASALNSLGVLMDFQSKKAEARDYYEKALMLARTSGNRRLEGGLLGNLGGLYLDLGELEFARSHFEQALALASEVGDRRWEGNAHCNLGLWYQQQGKADAARAQFETALTMAQQAGQMRLEYAVLCNLGMLLTSEGRLPEAADHLQRAVRAAVASSDRRSEGQFRGYLALALARQGLVDDARESLDIGEQILLAVSDRLSYALLLCDRAEVEQIAARPSEALRAIARSQRIALELNCGPESDLRHRLAALSLAAHATP